MEDVYRAVHEAVIDAGPKELAHLMGTSHTGLLNRANPNDDTHRLNFEQFLQILVHTPDQRKAVLAELVGQFGYELTEKGESESVQLTSALLTMHKEVAEVTTKVASAMADGHLSSTEKAAIKREIADVRRCLDVLERSVKEA